MTPTETLPFPLLDAPLVVTFTEAEADALGAFVDPAAHPGLRSDVWENVR